MGWLFFIGNIKFIDATYWIWGSSNHHSIFSAYNTKEEQQRFMSSVILLPLFIALLLGNRGVVLPFNFSCLVHSKPVIANYTWVVFVVAVATAILKSFTLGHVYNYSRLLEMP